jgi:adenylate cyclase
MQRSINLSGILGTPSLELNAHSSSEFYYIRSRKPDGFRIFTLSALQSYDHMTFRIHVFDNETRMFSGDVEGVLELGRQQNGEPPSFAMFPTGGKQRLVIADLTFTKIARHQLRIEPLNDGTLRLTNLSSNVALRLRGEEALEVETSRVLVMPVTVYISPTQYVKLHDVTAESNASPEFESLATRTLAPGMRQQFSTFVPMAPGTRVLVDGEQIERIVQGLREAMEILQNARTADALYDAAVTGAVKVVDFDGAKLLRYSNDQWKEEKQYGRFQSAVSQHVLNEVLKHSKTHWSSTSGRATESLAKLDAFIAVPVLDRTGNVIGALYGERQCRLDTNSFREITRTDAHLMELLAYGVASELSRRSHEEESRRLQTRFEQFFSPELARELEAQPNLLEGRDVDVSILFCDIRGFSRISERVDTLTIFRFINEVIGAVSECVVRSGGVVVDYVGDAVMAMWGAPQVQPNHAELACRAALEMFARLPDLNSAWHSRIGEDIDFAIGINTGPARAGNSGSEHKFKYGPLGKTVNLASRVQGATKYLKTRILITKATATAVRQQFHCRKICDGQVININEPVGFYELNSKEDLVLNHGYEHALRMFEEQQFRPAARELSLLLEQFPHDGPTVVLLSRCVNAIVDGPEQEHPILVLKGK